jgi:hypothetical protein
VREAIWDALTSLVRRHREFAEAQWALPPEEVNAVEQSAASFEPKGADKRRAWLFNDHMPEIPDVQRGGGDWGAYNSALARLRAEAADEIAAAAEWPGLLRFAHESKLPLFFGIALADAGLDQHENELVALLNSQDAHDLNFAYGYLERRFRADGWSWLERLLTEESLAPKQVARLLLSTLDYPRAWEVADDQGEEVARLFWQEFRTWGLGADFPHVDYVTRRLMGVGRNAIALDFIHLYMRASSDDDTADDPQFVDLVAEALDQLINREAADPELGALSQHDFVDLFAYLARAGLPSDRLARLEWAYLPAFGYDARPLALGRLMADDPGFFAEVVALVYRPSGPDDESEETETEEAAGDDATASESEATPNEGEEQRQARAANAYRLLSEWRTVPGVDENGALDQDSLNAWIARARERLAELGRSDAGDVHIGRMLAWSPPAPDGKWPIESVRNLLERLQNERLERGMSTELYNSRGVSTRSPFAGGGQERELAESYRERAAGYVDRWPRSAAVLLALAHSLESDARRWDDDAERTHRGMR